MDENYLLAAARYVERNPVRAGDVEKPWEYSWSSTSAQLAGRDDLLVKGSPLLQVSLELKGRRLKLRLVIKGIDETPIASSDCYLQVEDVRERF